MSYYFCYREKGHRYIDSLLLTQESLDSSNSVGANLGKMDEGPGSAGPGINMNCDLATSCGNSAMRLPSAPKAFCISSSCGKECVRKVGWDVTNMECCSSCEFHPLSSNALLMQSLKELLCKILIPSPMCVIWRLSLCCSFKELSRWSWQLYSVRFDLAK